MLPRVKHLLYGWSNMNDQLTQFMIGSWWAAKEDRPGGTAICVHLVPPKSLLREDELVLDQTSAIAFVHAKVITPLVEVGDFTDVVFERKKVIVGFVPGARYIDRLVEPAEKLDVRPWKLEKVEVLRSGASYRFDPLASRCSEWLEPLRGPIEKKVMRVLKKLDPPRRSFEKLAGLDKPKLEPGSAS